MPQRQIFSVNDAGHDYTLMGEATGYQQRLMFFKKVTGQNSTNDREMLHIAHDGVTTETVLLVLLNRMQYLQDHMPCRENAVAITKMEEALMWLEKRTTDRRNRGVEGTNQN